MTDTRSWSSILDEIGAQFGPISHSGFPSVIHRHAVPGLASRWRRRPRLKRVVADIFAQGFLSMLADPPAMDDRSRSSQGRQQFSPGTAMRRRTSSRALCVFCHLDFCPSTCVDSASRWNLTLAGLKDVAKLAAYFIATLLVGALVAPTLFWSAQSLAAHGVFSFLARNDFETFFHRALLVAAVLLL